MSKETSKLLCDVCKHKTPCPEHCVFNTKHKWIREAYCELCGYYNGKENFAGNLELSKLVR